MNFFIILICFIYRFIREKCLGPKRAKQSEMPEISSILKYAEALSTLGRDDDGLKKLIKIHMF